MPIRRGDGWTDRRSHFRINGKLTRPQVNKSASLFVSELSGYQANSLFLNLSGCVDVNHSCGLSKIHRLDLLH